MLFTKEFLNEVSKQESASIFLNHLMEEHEFTFREAVLKIASFYSIQPKYVLPGDKYFSLHQGLNKKDIDGMMEKYSQ